jgi:crossover junction endodeoxyribonuclease RusA
MTPEGKALKESYQWQAMSQVKEVPMHFTDGDLTVTVTLFFGNRRKRDIDNQLKLILDALTGIVWTDDKQIVDLRIVKAYDKPQPRAEIVIE